MGSALADLIRQARSLARERDGLVERIARRWTVALRGQPLSGEDLEQLWAALAEETLRGVLKNRTRRWPPEMVRQEVAEVIARVRAQVEHALTTPSDEESESA